MARKTSEDEWDGRTVRLYYMGRQYSIPIDSEGYVPVEAMVMRYQECGNNGRDKGADAAMIYPSRARPKEILKWWADPSSCDIQGIDTKKSTVYDVSGIRGKRMKAVQRRIGIVTPSPKEQQRIRRILANAFTVEELERMAKDGSFVIRTIKDGGDVVGYYLRRSDGQEVPLITLEEGCTPDHVVHEAVHHLRTTRPPGKATSSAFPQRADGKVDMRRYNAMSDAERRMVHDVEEVATTMEATARTHYDPDPTGYWDYAGGRLAYEHDKRQLAQLCGGGNCTLKGAAAVKAVEKNKDRLEIAMSSILSDVPAKDSIRIVQSRNAPAPVTKPEPSPKPKPAERKQAPAPVTKQNVPPVVKKATAPAAKKVATASASGRSAPPKKRSAPAKTTSKKSTTSKSKSTTKKGARK